MSWLLFALICILGWGCADVFYKKSSNQNDGQSHLKIAVWVGLIMGIVSFLLIPFSESGMSPSALLLNMVKYSPASLSYIISMVIGFAGLRYLEVSIVSPIQNASGAFSAIFIFFWFLFKGKISSFSDEFSFLDIAGTVLIVTGVIFVAIIEQRLYSRELKETGENKKYRFGALALIFPILYCIFDTIGTTADGIILDENSGLNLGEIDVIILYGITFFTAGAGCWIYMLIKNKKAYNPFAKDEVKSKGVAAICEEFGQIFYVYAMAAKPVIAAPMVASYCIVSVILSRIFLKEKLCLSHYASIAAVIIGIICLGISEGVNT